jgi:hypothetical protein
MAAFKYIHLEKVGPGDLEGIFDLNAANPAKIIL